MTQLNEKVEPFYLKKADRPKKSHTFFVHKEDMDFLNTPGYISVRSSFVRFLFDCYRAGIPATPAGFVLYRQSGEKSVK